MNRVLFWKNKSQIQDITVTAIYLCALFQKGCSKPTTGVPYRDILQNSICSPCYQIIRDAYRVYFTIDRV